MPLCWRGQNLTTDCEVLLIPDDSTGEATGSHREGTSSSSFSSCHMFDEEFIISQMCKAVAESRGLKPTGFGSLLDEEVWTLARFSKWQCFGSRIVTSTIAMKGRSSYFHVNRWLSTYSPIWCGLPTWPCHYILRTEMHSQGLPGLGQLLEVDTRTQEMTNTLIARIRINCSSEKKIPKPKSRLIIIADYNC